MPYNALIKIWAFVEPLEDLFFHELINESNFYTIHVMFEYNIFCYI